MLIGIKKTKMSKDVLGISSSSKNSTIRDTDMVEEMSARSGISTQ